MQVQLSTRLEEDVAEVLAEVANREKRSVSAQIALIGEQWIAKVQTEQSHTQD
jgi:hypothetical protein